MEAKHPILISKDTRKVYHLLRREVLGIDYRLRILFRTYKFTTREDG